MWGINMIFPLINGTFSSTLDGIHFSKKMKLQAAKTFKLWEFFAECTFNGENQSENVASLKTSRAFQVSSSFEFCARRFV